MRCWGRNEALGIPTIDFLTENWVRFAKPPVCFPAIDLARMISSTARFRRPAATRYARLRGGHMHPPPSARTCFIPSAPRLRMRGQGTDPFCASNWRYNVLAPLPEMPRNLLSCHIFSKPRLSFSFFVLQVSPFPSQAPDCSRCCAASRFRSPCWATLRSTLTCSRLAAQPDPAAYSP